MAVIFVHGVNNRMADPEYETRRLVTEHFLKQWLRGATIDGRKLGEVTPVFPYWGDLATTFAWNMQSLPVPGTQALGSPGVPPDMRPLVAGVRDLLAVPGAAAQEPLTALAKASLPRAVDALNQVMLQTVQGQQEDVARFVVEAQAYAIAFEPPAPPPAWLASVTTDAQFCSQLLLALKGQADQPRSQALGGLFDKIGNAVAAGAAKLKQATQSAGTKLLDASGDFASTKVLAWSRASLNATLGRFFGDVFLYLDGRKDADKPGAIPARLLAEWDRAIAASAHDEPLIIIGHSLGGVITYDLLTHFRPGLVVDLFVSVGSQVSHFEEMKLFKVSDRQKYSSALGNKVPKPPNVKHWINVYDEVDIFSYACSRIFDGVQDHPYDTKTYVIKAHGAYFDQARFYERLRARIDELPQPKLSHQ
jgi:hypothetical protein